MNESNTDIPLHVLVAPLNWGLGHASRCMPIINDLLKRGVKVSLAGDGLALALLAHSYPQLDCFEIPGYQIQYARNSQHVLRLLRQLPRILSAISKEHKSLLKLVEEKNIDAIISDNRYGLWHPKIPTAFICHQISPLPPKSLNFTFKSVQQFHLNQIHKFDYCWIPDHEGAYNLSGKLSHTPPLPRNTHFLGPLSRFANMDKDYSPFSMNQLNEEPIDIVAVLSGPEPQRSMLEELILSQAKGLDRPLWIIRGLTDRNEIEKIGNIVRVSFMGTEDLNRVFTKANMIISRSGYSSLMDYASLGLRSVILIPTPGQTEQEYLATILDKQSIAFHTSQNNFDLIQSIRTAPSYKGFQTDTQSNQLKNSLDTLLAKAKNLRYIE